MKRLKKGVCKIICVVYHKMTKTGIFGGSFCKNTVYRFLNNAKINWSRFTTLLSSRIINVLIDLIKAAQLSEVSAKYVLLDSWFSSPKTITALRIDCGLDTIAMVKKSSKIKYGYQGGKYNIKEIYKQCKKRRGRSKYLLSVDVTVGDEAIPAKIVCVRNKSKKFVNYFSVSWMNWMTSLSVNP